MNRLSDEVLIAYVNGSLDSVERKLVEDSAKNDPELQTRIASYREIEASLRNSPGSKSEQKVLFTRSTRGEVAKKLHDNVTREHEAHGRLQFLTRFTSLKNLGLSHALLALIALVIGFGAHSLVSNGPRIQPAKNDFVTFINGELRASSNLREALEKVPNGKRFSLSGTTGFVLPTLTFQDQHNRYCREYDLSITTSGRASGVACRSRSGHWRVVVHVKTKSSRQSPNTFAPASDGDTQFVTWASERMQRGKAIGSKAVGILIEKDWKGPEK